MPTKRCRNAWLGVLCLLLLCGSAMAQAKPPSSRIRLVKLGQLNYIYLRDLAAFYGMNYRASGEGATLSSRTSRLVFTDKSRIFQFNGINAHLSYATGRAGREFIVAHSDFSTLIDPVLRRSQIPRRQVRRILIDPGHGGNDPGAQHGGVREKSVNLVLARKVAAILAKRGFVVTMTRSSDRPLTLAQRTAMVQAQKPDLFLSLHCNAAGDASIHGIETYIANPAGTPSSGGNVVARQAAPANRFDRENALLGFLLQQNLLSASGAFDRGLRRKQFYVIREAGCPAALVEFGFLSHPSERGRLLQSAYQDKVAVAVCDAVGQFARMVQPPARP